MWYGKAPGIDRATDALRHANYSGVSRTGGGLIVVGDDPNAKSSTIPSASESLLESLHVPTFYPGTVQEVLDLGLHAWACSRASGLWSALKIVTNVADAAGTAQVAPDRISPVLPTIEWEGQPFEYTPNASMLAPASLEMERTLLGPRTETALAYARANGVNLIERFGADAWIGVVASGKSYHDLRQAFADMGLDDRGLARAGVRLLHLGMIWPLDPEVVREFAAGLDEIVVVEEKLPFLERQLKEILYGEPGAPRVLGKKDDRGASLLPAEGELDADAIARALGPRLLLHGSIDSVEGRLRKLAESASRPLPLPMAARTPFFCSGCPHNSSTPAPDGTLVGAGIGCHTMILLNPEGRGDITGITQMGGEGAQWIGMAPFTDDEHFVQNLGDGTFHHSGSLAVRAAIAADVNVTYKLFYNDAVAMTGGQAVEGQISVPELTRWLEIEGVKRIIITTEDTRRYKGVSLAPIAEVRDRSELMAAQEELAEEPGVTVLIHDQECAAEKRRKRKRGKLEEPPQQVHINERVCEGCGDCGHEVGLPERDPGRDRVRAQDADPPVVVQQGLLVPRGRLPVVPDGHPPEAEAQAGPRSRRPTPLCRAARPAAPLQRLGVHAPDDGNRRHRRRDRQPGDRRRGADRRPARGRARPDRPQPEGRPGRVRHAHLARAARRARTACPRRAPTYTSASTCSARRTRRTLPSPTRTGRWPSCPRTRCRPARWCSTRSRASRPSRASFRRSTSSLAASRTCTSTRSGCRRSCFGDHMPANMLALGAAWQRGALPLSLSAIEEAIRLNGAGVEKNLAAFAWGRALCPRPGGRRRCRAAGGAEARRGPRGPARRARARAGRVPERGVRRRSTRRSCARSRRSSRSARRARPRSPSRSPATCSS